MRSLPAALLIGATLFGAAACHHEVQPDPVANQSAKPQLTAQQPAASAPANPVDQPRAEGSSDLDAALRELSQVSLFFQYDEATLTPQAEAKLAQVADVLQKHNKLSIEVQGNCDERGTETYNLALGQRRADTARNYLVRLGARPEQISSVSLGDQKPKATGHDEQAWSQNRRDDVVAK